MTGSVPGHTNNSISGQAGKRSELGESQCFTDTHYVPAAIGIQLVSVPPPFSLSLTPIMSVGAPQLQNAATECS